MWGASIRAVDVTGDIYNLYGWILHIFAVPSQWASEITNTLLPETPSPATPHSRHDDKVVLVMLICHQGFAGGFCRGRCKQPRSPGSSAQSRSKRSKIFLRRVSGLVGTYIDTRAVNHRAEVRRSFIPTTVRDESQVTPQGRHRWGSNQRLNIIISIPSHAHVILKMMILCFGQFFLVSFWRFKCVFIIEIFCRAHSMISSNLHQDTDHKEPVDRSSVLLDSISTADKDLVISTVRFNVANFHDPIDFSMRPKRFWRMSWVAITSKLVGKGMDCSPINRMDL